jgi:hypothetical protein
MLKKLIFASMALLLGSVAQAQPAAPDVAKPIRAVISKTYDQPGKPVKTDPVVVSGDHAVADWIQGNFGGRALLRREKGKWVIVLCAGDGLRQAQVLEQSGVPQAEARSIARQLAAAEDGLPAERRKLFSLFGTEEGAKVQHEKHHPTHQGAPKS